MHAAVLHTYGDPVYDEFPDPVPTGTQQVVEVLAAGVNPADLLLSSGKFYVRHKTLPCVVGLDGVGHLADGRRVYFESTLPPYGAAAQRALIDADACVAIQEDIDDATAASLGNAGIAAWLSLEWKAQLTRGETVLVLGASGTVGSIAVQVAKTLGADRVIAAGRDHKRLQRAIELGAEGCVDLNQPDAVQQLQAAVGSGGVDVIIDLLWGKPAMMALQLAAPGARLIQIGNSAGVDASIGAGTVRSKSLAILGYSNYQPPRELRHSAYRRLIEHAAAGDLRVEIEPVPLRDVQSAWERQRAGASSKLVLIPGAG